MICYRTINIADPRYKYIKGVNKEKVRLEVPCGKCYACRQNRRSEWMYRLSKELQYSTNAYFVTLTYNDRNIPLKNGKQVLRKSDLQSYIKRLRHYVDLRYYAVGEYGEGDGTELKRPHYHILMFGLNNFGKSKRKYIDRSWNYEYNRKLEEWKFKDVGFVHIGKVEQGSIHYVTKDMMKDVTKKQVEGIKGFTIMSINPPIGIREEKLKGYREKEKPYLTKLNGANYKLPKIIIDKVFTEEEKRQFSLEKRNYAEEVQKEFEKMCEKKKVNRFKYREYARRAKERVLQKQLKNRKL